MTERTRATWRFRLGQHLCWRGDGHVCLITARRWSERHLLAPSAEYQVERPYVGMLWVVESDMDELFTEPPVADEGKAL